MQLDHTGGGRSDDARHVAAGRITQPGHVMTIVRNVVRPEAVNGIGRVRMLDDRKAQQQVSLAVSLI